MRCRVRHGNEVSEGKALWVVWAKGRRELTENHISATHSPLKLVIPKPHRGA